MNLPCSGLLQQTSAWQGQVLGAVCFSTKPIDRAQQGAAPFMQVGMQTLAASTAMCEIWYSDAVLTQGRYEAIDYCCDAEVVFGVVVLAEADFAGDAPLRQATEAAYRQIGALLDSLNYPYVFRYWNYMAEINAEQDKLERYQQFNFGRQSALLAHGQVVAGNVPAACALGAASGELSIAFLAGRVAPVAIENPRQLSAYTYPPVYGPRSPVFSRASLVNLAGDEWLFISGTASIVGHSSLHKGDVGAQTRETMFNIAAVLGEANRLAEHRKFNLADLQFKVYIRHPDDFAEVRAELEKQVGGPADAIYLQADVCRQELLVEIEATAGLTSPLATYNEL